jgi:hypothetical protein
MTASADHKQFGVIIPPLDRLSRTAEQKGVPRSDIAKVRQFLEFKAHAATKWAQGIQEATREEFVKPTPFRPYEIPTGQHKVEQWFRLQMLLDAYLSSAASIRDALFQVANVSFQLGIPPDDRQMRSKIRKTLNVTASSRTGLERWLYENDKRYRWLEELDRLRNTTTHRSVLRFHSVMDIADGNWIGIRAVEIRPQLMADVGPWVAGIEARLYRLVAHSVRQLTVTLKRRT